MNRIRRWTGSRRRRSGVSTVISAVLLVGITVILMGVLYLLHLPVSPPAPTVSYIAVTGVKLPVFGDPTDCFPNLPHSVNWYLGNGTGNATDQARWNAYMSAWTAQCQNGFNGTYNVMNVTEVVISAVSNPIPLSQVEFLFSCTNTTPTAITTTLAAGPLASMEWVPGSSLSLPPTAPKLGNCATFHAAGSGTNSVYYNRLGFFNPLNYNTPFLTPGQTIVIYLHTANSVFEAPSPVEPQSNWNQPDSDDYHGAPPWCVTTQGACTLYLIDTSGGGNILLSLPFNLL